VLTLAGEKGPTCHLRRDPALGIWKGRWLHHERMPIELIPADTAPSLEARPQESVSAWIARSSGST